MRAEGHNSDHRIDELERRASLGLLLEQTSRSFKRFSIAHQHDRISGTEVERRIASVEGFSRAHDGDDDRPGDSPQVQRGGILAECRGPRPRLRRRRALRGCRGGAARRASGRRESLPEAPYSARCEPHPAHDGWCWSEFRRTPEYGRTARALPRTPRPRLPLRRDA